jgi:SAM-dependent methyltransferase
MKADYIEFSNPHLVSIYNAVNAIDSYKDFYLSLVQKIAAKKIIDIGCGTGLLTCALAKHGCQMIGVEPSEDMINIAKKNEYGENVTWIVGDALKLKRNDADLAIMTGHVVQFYLEDTYWDQALKSINTSLRVGGHIAFESRNPAVKPWFKGWPDKEEAANSYSDSIKGEIKWWYEPIKIKGNRILYKNRYFIVKTQEHLTSINELIFRSKEEITKSLQKNGFNVEAVYGDWDGRAFDKSSEEMIFVAKKDYEIEKF